MRRWEDRRATLHRVINQFVGERLRADDDSGVLVPDGMVATRTVFGGDLDEFRQRFPIGGVSVHHAAFKHNLVSQWWSSRELGRGRDA